MSIPSDLGDIEPIATKLWNCDEIGLDDGQRFMSPIIMHQSNKYYKDLHFNIPMYRKFHHTPFGYMDRDGWLKSMTQFSNACGASPVNNQTIFFDGHDSHFYDLILIDMDHQNIQPFIPKSGNYINYHPNNNVSNAKPKSLYNETGSIPRRTLFLQTILFE